MKKPGLMTMSMFFRLFFKFQADQDEEDLVDGYQEMLDLVQEAGFQAVDVISWEVKFLGLERVKRMLAGHGLSVNSYIAFGEYARMDEEGFAGRIEQGKHDADTAAELGTDVLMLVPQAQEGIGEYAPEVIRTRLTEHWRPIVEYAKEKVGHVVIEDTPDLKLHLCKAADVMEVLDKVPGLELVYDSANMTLVGEDPLEYLKAFEGRIGYVHMKDYRPTPPGGLLVEYAEDGTKMSTAPVGTGIIDIKGIAAELEKAGYNGGMTMEFVVDDDGDFPKSLKRTCDYLAC
ncbi:hypothetical protein GCM10008910_06510 [Faecalicatena orotica]|uniref:Sugar phosphate isomerase/epimerase n=1 Tax=Faecalicatena orotica TaxID=1544 RepID=A0A2Y9BAC4_9FIRM|nr:sugar phosphate isomerase/epimerase family protein [Faecalicatena orotica]PWJ30680.1 sugar phosphate isomerase/epimerase [Faecalicatena orotica]SSA54841.1 Sugar phosphate isomerase/epimerase [Faecalicatena orotica]